MDIKKQLEEELREAACFSDLETLQKLISRGVDVNSKNDMNGWTALHWASHRGNVEAVSILLSNGADKTAVTRKGDLPCDLARNHEVNTLLEGGLSKKEPKQLPIIPNYLKNPPILHQGNNTNKRKFPTHSTVNSNEDLVLKVRVADSLETDFIEIELPASELSYEKLKEVCCKELDIKQHEILKIRKLPNTIVRNDKDVLRLKEFQELEIVKSKAS